MDQHVQCVFTNKKLSICKHTVHALVFAQICVRDIPTTKKYMGGQECQIIFFLWVRVSNRGGKFRIFLFHG